MVREGEIVADGIPGAQKRQHWTNTFARESFVFMMSIM